MTNLIDFTTSNVDQEKYFNDPEYKASVDAALTELAEEADIAEKEAIADEFVEMQKYTEEVLVPAAEENSRDQAADEAP